MKNATQIDPSRVKPDFPPIIWRRWRVFRPGGAIWRPGHYLKLVYGLLGLIFLVLTASTTGIGKPEGTPSNTAPSAWYWQWLVAIHPAPTVTTDTRIDDEDDPYRRFGGEQSDASSAAGSTASSWGTDAKGHSVRQSMGQGAKFYIVFGLLSGLLGILGGICWAVITEWPTRPKIPLPHTVTRLRRWIGLFGRSSMEMVDTIPKFLLLISIFALGGVPTRTTFMLAMAVFLMFGTATLFRDRIATFLAGEQYIYALEIGLSRARVFFVHLIGRQLAPSILVQLPFMISAFLLWEATLSYFDWGPNTITWGALLCDNFQRAESYWAFWIPLLSLLFVISSLYVLGDALRERVEPEDR